MKKIKDNVLPLSLMLLIPLINTAYLFLNNSSRGVHYLVTDIDKSIPLIKLFAIPYLIWYPFIALTLIYFCLYHRKIYYKVIISLILGMILCFIIYYFFQTSVPRPKMDGSDFLTNLLRFIYGNDSPYNCFPSIHVLTCYLMIIGVRETNKQSAAGQIIVITTAILIILSTQFIKQHVILDLISAVILGSSIYKIANSFSIEKSYIWVKKQYWWLIAKKDLEI